ncbi:MAG: LamG domain-containing protein [Candidatus Saelkia tenebricola]|nr:LamG domain-containing protein [Candidatus Saelkia tenebricola]
MKIDANGFSKNGVTFVSVVILVAVVSLSVWSVLVLSDVILKSQTVEKTEIEMEKIRKGLVGFYKDCDQFPQDTNVIATDFADLQSQPATSRFEGSASLKSYRQSVWEGTYFEGGFDSDVSTPDLFDVDDYTYDAWRTNYVYDYTAGATTCTLTSYGLNRISGGGDDIIITVYANDIVEEKIRKTKNELAYINAKKEELETRYDNAGESWPPAGFDIDDLFRTYGADTAGLVGWWKLDDGSGNTADDSSSGGHNGTLESMESSDWINSGKLGKALNFDGSNEYIQINDHADFDIGTGFTYEAWIKPTSFPKAYNMFMGHYLPHFNVRNNGKLHLSMGASGQKSILGTTTLVANNWYHVAGVYDGDDFGSMTIYLNGDVDNSVSGTLVTPYIPATDYASRQFIGKGQSANSYQFTGTIDEVRVWSRALPDSDVFQEYLRGSYLTDWAYKYDEWQTEYVWDSIDDEFYSYGPNKASGGGDDITQD